MDLRHARRALWKQLSDAETHPGSERHAGVEIAVEVSNRTLAFFGRAVEQACEVCTGAIVWLARQGACTTNRIERHVA